ncbi:MAG TPA: archease [Actinomycetota bacterium]|nr:archease [Actinomycetota bacterium]
MSYELIEHTADVGLEIRAQGLDELFEESARALLSVMGEVRGEPAITQRVELDGPDAEALLVDWLSELLYLFEVRAFVPVSIRARITPAPDPDRAWRLEADMSGCDASGFVQHGPAVKAVTYHGIQVTVSDSGASARVYLDV